MKLYLLRHAEAEPTITTDAARELTARGIEQARNVGLYCARRHLQPEVILTSPLRRAEQTAALAGESLEQRVEPQTERFLASGMDPQTALEELRAYQRLNDVMIVGHQPDFGMLAAELIGMADAENLAVGKASLTCIEVERLAPGMGLLRFSLPVRMMVG
jgi:phosphohistidine phosphatase